MEERGEMSWGRSSLEDARGAWKMQGEGCAEGRADWRLGRVCAEEVVVRELRSWRPWKVSLASLLSSPLFHVSYDTLALLSLLH